MLPSYFFCVDSITGTKFLINFLFWGVKFPKPALENPTKWWESELPKDYNFNQHISVIEYVSAYPFGCICVPKAPFLHGIGFKYQFNQISVYCLLNNLFNFKRGNLTNRVSLIHIDAIDNVDLFTACAWISFQKNSFVEESITRRAVKRFENWFPCEWVKKMRPKMSKLYTKGILLLSLNVRQLNVRLFKRVLGKATSLRLIVTSLSKTAKTVRFANSYNLYFVFSSLYCRTRDRQFC